MVPLAAMEGSVSYRPDEMILRDYCVRGGSIILIGMSGVGKTTVGRRLAYLHGLNFVDTDAEIETSTRMRIADIFREHGEPGFREIEREVIGRVLQEHAGSVIATGGGAYLDPGLREQMRAAGVSVWMKAPPSVLVRRVRRFEHRPLLQTGDPFKILTELLTVREPFYAQADVAVDIGRTGFSRDRTVARVVRSIVEFIRSDQASGGSGLRMVSVPAGGGHAGYQISIGAGQLAHVGRVLTRLYPQQRRTCVVCDDGVAPLYLEAVQADLQQHGVEGVPCIVPAGEASKSWTQLQAVCETVLQAGVERGQAIVALGGGVVGDLTGMVAGLVRRGIEVIQVPTTLLAQVDSSVGGKTGINSVAGKNLIGLFHRPAAVLIDTDTLRTLPPRQLRAGYAEVLKYALLGDRDFFSRLEVWLERGVLATGDLTDIEAVVARCVAMKAGIVTRDEHEHGERALLNLGHTFGHAFEAEAGYDDAVLLHGEAVALGMACAFRLSVQLKMCPPDDLEAVLQHLQRVGLPFALEHLPFAATPERLIERMRQDKKNRNGRIAFVLAHGIGHAVIRRDVEDADVLAMLRHA